MRRASKVDKNQNDIVDLLRTIPGLTVEVGHHDILVGYRGKTYWYEIKDPHTVSKKTGKILKGEIKPSEQKRLDTFTGHYKIVWNVQQIIKEINKENS